MDCIHLLKNTFRNWLILWSLVISQIIFAQKPQTDFVSKLSPSLFKKITTHNQLSNRFIVVSNDFEALNTLLSKYPKSLSIISRNEAAKAIIIKCSWRYLLKNIASYPPVIFIDEYIEPTTEIAIIGYDRSFHGINTLDFELPSANGKNIVVGVKEQKMQPIDLDIIKRVLPSSIANPNIEDHATVISSIIGGAGNTFYNGRGLANQCKFFPSSYANLFVDDAKILETNQVSVQNHSYGTTIQQFYGAEAKSYDEHTWVNKNFIHVFSAGNKGSQSATGGKYLGLNNFANLTGNFKMAKNIITVGAVNNAGLVSAESSSGPLYDGRLAPQITALGPNGTSDAAAMVTGTIAVMQQVFSDNNQQKAPASLIKAVLYNTTDDIYRAGIDYKTGFGLLNSYQAVVSLQQKNYEGASVSRNNEWTKTLNIPNEVAKLKITLAWTDSTSQISNQTALINDLDLEVKEISTGKIYKPWVLSSFPNLDSLNKFPIRKRDSLNTAEQVSIALPKAGQYQIKVFGKKILSPSIPFHVAFNFDTLNTFKFISPQNTSDVNIQKNENLTIKWRAFLADTLKTGSLFISYNEGKNWQLLDKSIKIHKGEFLWKIKDTSSTAVLKMETNFGAFQSKKFILSRVNRLNVDFVCADTFRISWQKHVYAKSYRIFTMIDSAFIKPIMIVSDTFKVLNRTRFPSKVYAIEPILSNGYSAARSVAIDVTDQSVGCFYKALNYNLFDNNNIELSLEISIPEYVDSVSFEEIDETGRLTQFFGSVKMVNSKYFYTRNGNILNVGLSYFRAKIHLKNKKFVYSDILSVLTSGKKQIAFYPNPVNANEPLNYILEQGTYSDNIIQFFDASGRYLKGYKTLPDKFDVSNFPSGSIFYKLMTKDFKILEGGKLVLFR